MRYFVTGGSGFVGRHLVLRLLADGHEVRALARSEQSADVVECLGATPVRADLLDLAGQVEALRGTHVAVHAATCTGGRGELERVDVGGTRALLQALEAAGVPRLVHLSCSVVVAGGHPVRYVAETAPYPRRHVSEHARSKAVSEQLALSARTRTLDVVALRPAPVWGPGDTSLWPQVAAAVADGSWTWVGNGEHLVSTCHVTNLCEGVVRASVRGRSGQAYFLTDGAPVHLRKFLTGLAAAHGVQLPERSIPTALARAGAGARDRGRRVLSRTGDPAPVGWVATFGAQEMTFDDLRARTELHYAPLVDLEEGMAELAADAVGPQGRC